ncbi:MAG: hypothetical protein DHS20C15_17690 [Planctomycetota bacterium]|nr:MAG: hypothetical protein DHS20C15_17690 [Planctomycetota bacterium]
MLAKRSFVALAVALTVALPAVASIKAMTLRELMSITSGAVHGTVVARETVQRGFPQSGAVYTLLTIRGESVRTGEPTEVTVAFHGSHEVADRYTISEMPTLQDTRIGAEVVAFFNPRKELDGSPVIFDYSGIYRVERAFDKPVLMGKGEGFAFDKNEALDVVRQRVRQVHQEQLVAKQKLKLGTGK